jgi:hypothetical protein
MYLICGAWVLGAFSDLASSDDFHDRQALFTL